jgi:MoaA/NifB/PqqE/SkfB family radical SAM enzyme
MDSSDQNDIIKKIIYVINTTIWKINNEQLEIINKMISYKTSTIYIQNDIPLMFNLLFYLLN